MRRADGWLLDTPAARACSVERGVDLGAAPAPFLLARQAAYRGPLASRITLGDARAQPLLGALMRALSVPAPVAASPDVTGPDPQGGLGMNADAFTAIVTNTAAFFRPRLARALAAGVAGLGAPITLGALPLTLDVSASEASIRTSPSLVLSELASLAFDTSNTSGALQIGSLAFSYAGGVMTAQAPDWLLATALPPAAGVLTARLDDALPRLLFSSLERRCPNLAMEPGAPVRREVEYIRHGTLCLMGAYDVRRGKLFGFTCPGHKGNLQPRRAPQLRPR